MVQILGSIILSFCRSTLHHNSCQKGPRGILGIQGTSMSKPLSRRSRDFFAGIRAGPAQPSGSRVLIRRWSLVTRMDTAAATQVRANDPSPLRGPGREISPLLGLFKTIMVRREGNVKPTKRAWMRRRGYPQIAPICADSKRSESVKICAIGG